MTGDGSAAGDLAEFRRSLDSWLDAEAATLAPGFEGAGTLHEQMAQLAKVKRLAFDAGWMRAGWPERVGGLGGSTLTRAYLGEALTARDLVEPGLYSMTEVLAPTKDKKLGPPKAKHKWVTASVVDDAASVVCDIFDEAERRDGDHRHRWVALVDGNNHQIDRIRTEARRRKVKVTIVVDLIHVLEYVWDSAWCFFKEGDPAAERWVHQKTLAILEGKAGIVAGAIRRKATKLGLSEENRAKADRTADYLLHKAPYLDYPTALQSGWPIATGVIEGACRHLVKDRMDITGARWGLAGAEAILKLRALITNGDFDQYWQYHLAHERHRNHDLRYANGVIPRQA